MSDGTAENLAVRIEHVGFRYGDRVALADVSMQIRTGEIFGLLGPNGSGKSTLFKLLSTLVPLQEGSVRILGRDVTTQAAAVRREIGVVFQYPALDKQLTVTENLRYHARLYGMAAKTIQQRIDELLERFRLADRADELVHTLSGGMRRKVELIKALLPRPRLLILDEPSTGLDVNARIDFAQALDALRADGELTVILTTHLMDEADRCDHIALLDQGRLLRCATPDALKDEIGGDVITFGGRDLDALDRAVRDRLHVTPVRVHDRLRIERPQAHLFVPELINTLPGMIDTVSIGRPTLDDVFVHLTGRQLHDTAADSSAVSPVQTAAAGPGGRSAGASPPPPARP